MKKKRLFSTIMASIVSISMMTAFPMGAWAAGTSYSGTIEGTKTTSFNKYLVMDVNANVPNATFTYTIASGTAIPADTNAGKLEVLAGIGTPVFKSNDETNTGSNTAGEAKFSPSDTNTTIAEANKGTDTVVFTTTDNTTDEKYAKKTLTIDFNSVQFTEPGVYRYIITESGTNQGVTNDSVLKRTLDVYVYDATDNTGKKLKIENYVMYSDEISTAPKADGSEPEAKSSSYTNTYTTHDLTFSKTVTGNQGSKDKYFKFTVNIADAVEGTVYTVDLEKADKTISQNPNTATTVINNDVTQPTSITVVTGGTATADFYLQDGQSITIKGIADGTSYTITEAQEDYTPTANITGDTTKADNSSVKLVISDKSASVSDDGLTDDTNVAFTNNRNGVLPTGIILSVGPTAIIGLALVGGIVFLIIRNKKRKYEE